MERVQISQVSVQSEERFTKRVCFNHPQALVFLLTFSPGQALPAHRHPGSAVVLTISAGSGEIEVDGATSPIAQGDLLLVTGDEQLAIRNPGSEALVVLVTLSPNPTNPAYAKEIG